MSASPSTSVTVTTTSDAADGDTTSFASLASQPGADGAISLREAILASNAMTTTAALSILFDIPTSDPGHDSATNTWTIAVEESALPPLAHGGVTIDGTSQPGSPSHPQIVLDGFDLYLDLGLANGITITSGRNTVRGLVVANFYDDVILISGPNAANNNIAGCYIGTSAAGGPSQQTSWNGVDLRDGAHGNMIGGDAGSRNLISGNENYGVLIDGASTRNNIVAGNWIGTNASGHAALPNKVAGVLVSAGAHDNTIGGAGQGNLISGNQVGIYLQGAVATTVAGNTIGLSAGPPTADGPEPLPNIDSGIFVRGGARGNLIGGTSAGARNVISGNGTSAAPIGVGVYIADAGTEGNTVQGNYIGADASGNASAGNYRQGVLIALDAQNNLVGGTAPGAGNVITYNGLGGVRIDAPANQVAGNLIGVGAEGAALGNQFNGVRVGGDGNTIGPGNTIAFNQHSGLLLTGIDNTVHGNTIESNGRSGICATGAGTTISDNTIQYNGSAAGPWPECSIRGGVVVAGANQALVSGNRIFSNNDAGVTIDSGVHNSILGNRIGDNSAAGIRLTEGGNNQVAPPLIRGVAQARVSGSACSLCRVEIFTDTGDEGRHFAGTTTAGSDGAFSFQLDAANLADPHVTATHTDANGNTSPFAPAVAIPKDQPTPTPSPMPSPTPSPPPRDSRRTYVPLVYR
jgi:titin